MRADAGRLRALAKRVVPPAKEKHPSTNAAVIAPFEHFHLSKGSPRPANATIPFATARAENADGTVRPRDARAVPGTANRDFTTAHVESAGPAPPEASGTRRRPARA